MTSKLGYFVLRIAIAAAAIGAAGSQAGLPLDIGVYRPSEGRLYLDFNQDGAPERMPVFGPPPKRVLVADMNGDGVADVVTYLNGIWTVYSSQYKVPDATYSFGSLVGNASTGSDPLLGDVDGDGTVDLVIYEHGVWYTSTRRDGIADRIDLFGGQPGDVPLLGDLTCDGVADRIVYRAGTWWMGFPDGSSVVVGGLGGDPHDVPFLVDWDGDCNADIGVYRDGEWYVITGVLEHPTLHIGAAFGIAGDIPVAGRLDDALTSPKYRRRSSHFGIYRPPYRAFFFRTLPGAQPDLSLYPGVAASHALAADLEGNGRSSLVLFNAGIWLVDHGLDGTIDDMYAFGGEANDVPLAGDVDGDGRDDLVIYRDGAWYASTAHDGSVSLVHYFGGLPGDIPVLGDIDGDGRADFGIYRAGIWYFDTSFGSSPPVTFVLGGVPGDVPLVADWNGDRKADLVIYRGGEWFVSTDPATHAVSLYETFGTPMDSPVAGNFVVETTATPALFAPQARPIAPPAYGMIGPTVADWDRDGRDEPLAGRNPGGGSILGIDLAGAGLASLFSSNRVNRDCRAADFNGDGFVDLACNTYSDIDNVASFARLFWGDGTGHFVEDPAFAAMGIRGYGETIVAADFNNDGAVDLFLPFYSQNDAREHSYLLVNDGYGHFTDIADAAGVALRNVPLEHRVEGAQAVDYDGDGWIDFYVAGRLFRNNGNLTFTDVTAAVGLPGDFDEGIKFFDWNDDGNLDLIIHHPIFGSALWEFDGTRFTRSDVMPQYLEADAYGVNVADVNGDGREDVIVAGGSATPYVLLNTGAAFERDPLTLFDDITSVGPISAYDYDGDGAIDLVLSRGLRTTIVARNISPDINRQTLIIEVVDAAGRRNQFGRVVRVRPDHVPGVTMTRVVDGGSAMLAQTPYSLTIPTPYPGTHRVDVRFAGANVSFTMQPGGRVRVYANGRTDPY